MTTPLLVTGGTGTLGRLIVPRLVEAGRTVRVLSRTPREPADGVEYVAADLRSDDAERAVRAAVDGVGTVLHLAGGPKGDDEATARLARAAADAGVRHLVHISVIGADRVPLAWFRMKLAAEQAVTGSGVPWTVLRAAQFHDLVLKTATAMARLPVIPVPGGLRFQPVDARDVAERLAELTLGEPAGLVADLAGPRVVPMGELLRSYLRAAGKRRALLPVRLPGRVGRAYRDGDNLTLDGADRGTRTWEDYLTERLGRRSPSL
ncbi:SDR family oxidoreductase [Jiangella rhizosphaerae]|uniref:SDR family oxidoreductase n=1 Tax=Jiangella rhizosphaerae TaxID=2293569 RepID=A0A418KY91_9ACTN|nr:SDR family oxidoreductase [Jiangella rhizosphaerae]RIQ37412.1 SDR family oxidoreductase [Jiangella rhizosphaerae]